MARMFVFDWIGGTGTIPFAPPFLWCSLIALSLRFPSRTSRVGTGTLVFAGCCLPKSWRIGITLLPSSLCSRRWPMRLFGLTLIQAASRLSISILSWCKVLSLTVLLGFGRPKHPLSLRFSCGKPCEAGCRLLIKLESIMGPGLSFVRYMDLLKKSDHILFHCPLALLLWSCLWSWLGVSWAASSLDDLRPLASSLEGQLKRLFWFGSRPCSGCCGPPRIDLPLNTAFPLSQLTAFSNYQLFCRSGDHWLGKRQGCCWAADLSR